MTSFGNFGLLGGFTGCFKGGVIASRIVFCCFCRLWLSTLAEHFLIVRGHLLVFRRSFLCSLSWRFCLRLISVRVSSAFCPDPRRSPRSSFAIRVSFRHCVKVCNWRTEQQWWLCLGVNAGTALGQKLKTRSKQLNSG